MNATEHRIRQTLRAEADALPPMTAATPPGYTRTALRVRALSGVAAALVVAVIGVMFLGALGPGTAPEGAETPVAPVITDETTPPPTVPPTTTTGESADTTTTQGIDSPGTLPNLMPLGPSTDLASMPPANEALLHALGPEFRPLSWDGNEEVGWVDVTVETPGPGGDRLTITAQHLDYVNRPLSHTDHLWTSFPLAPYEAVISPASNPNAMRQLWVVTDTHQIGFVLVAQQQQELQISIEDQPRFFESVAGPVAATLMELSGNTGDE